MAISTGNNNWSISSAWHPVDYELHRKSYINFSKLGGFVLTRSNQQKSQRVLWNNNVNQIVHSKASATVVSVNCLKSVRGGRNAASYVVVRKKDTKKYSIVIGWNERVLWLRVFRNSLT